MEAVFLRHSQHLPAEFFTRLGERDQARKSDGPLVPPVEDIGKDQLGTVGRSHDCSVDRGVCGRRRGGGGRAVGSSDLQDHAGGGSSVAVTQSRAGRGRQLRQGGQAEQDRPRHQSPAQSPQSPQQQRSLSISPLVACPPPGAPPPHPPTNLWL